jgi:hypothetical protein
VAGISEVRCGQCAFVTRGYLPAGYLVDVSPAELDAVRGMKEPYSELVYEGRVILPAPLFDSVAKRLTGRSFKELKAEGRVHVSWPILCNACGNVSSLVPEIPFPASAQSVIEWSRTARCVECRADGGTPLSDHMGARSSPLVLLLFVPPLVAPIVAGSLWWAIPAMVPLVIAIILGEPHARRLRKNLSRMPCPKCKEVALQVIHTGVV